jgi:GDP-mannose transporter
LKNGNFLKDASVGVFVPYTWMALNCLTTAMYSLFLRSKIGAVGFKDYDTVYYNNLLSLPLLLVLSILFEGEEFYKTVERYTVTVPGDFPGLVISIALSGVTTFGIGYCSSWCIRTTSSTTFRYIRLL